MDGGEGGQAAGPALQLSNASFSRKNPSSRNTNRLALSPSGWAEAAEGREAGGPGQDTAVDSSGHRGEHRSRGSPPAQEGLLTLCFPISDAGITLCQSFQTRSTFTLLSSSPSPSSYLQTK